MYKIRFLSSLTRTPASSRQATPPVDENELLQQQQEALRKREAVQAELDDLYDDHASGDDQAEWVMKRDALLFSINSYGWAICDITRQLTELQRDRETASHSGGPK